jgi:hypothetical protein
MLLLRIYQVSSPRLYRVDLTISFKPTHTAGSPDQKHQRTMTSRETLASQSLVNSDHPSSPRLGSAVVWLSREKRPSGAEEPLILRTRRNGIWMS